MRLAPKDFYSPYTSLTILEVGQNGSDSLSVHAAGRIEAEDQAGLSRIGQFARFVHLVAPFFKVVFLLLEGIVYPPQLPLQLLL